MRKAAALLGTHPTEASVDRLMAEHFKGFVPAPEHKQAILKRQLLSRTSYIDPVTFALGMMVANNSQAYWLTAAPANQLAMVVALGTGAERFKGYQGNGEFGKILKMPIDCKGAQREPPQAGP